MTGTTGIDKAGAATAVLVRAIVGSQKILADYLEPGGIGREQAVNLLLGILDHEEVVRAVADVARAQASPAHA